MVITSPMPCWNVWSEWGLMTFPDVLPELLVRALRRWGLRLLLEAEVAVRMMADNASATLVPPLLFTAAASAHYQIDGASFVRTLLICAGQFLLYQYIFDASNQVRASAEDAVNKPYRPIPSGIVSAPGLLRRFWWSMLLFTLAGWLTGTLVWVLLWQAVVVLLNLVSKPHQYIVVKPVAMILGTIAQLAAAWTLVGPLDATGWTWVLVIAIAFNLAMPFEDVRDLEGDRQIGRRTLAMVVGEAPVRIWFALNMFALPAVLHTMLLLRETDLVIVLVACDVPIVAISWTAAVRSMLWRGVQADRLTYLLYTFAYGTALAIGIPILGL